MYHCAYIYRERNICVDKLASHGTIIQGLYWCELIPNFLVESFVMKHLLVVH
jgi:hypothetical protein